MTIPTRTASLIRRRPLEARRDQPTAVWHCNHLIPGGWALPFCLSRVHSAERWQPTQSCAACLCAQQTANNHPRDPPGKAGMGNAQEIKPQLRVHHHELDDTESETRRTPCQSCLGSLLCMLCCLSCCFSVGILRT